jgi:hypothetical protein
MFGRRSPPLDQCSDSQVRESLVCGTLVGGAVVVGSFFGHGQPESFLWSVRVFGLICLVFWWRSHFLEFRRRKRNR